MSSRDRHRMATCRTWLKGRRCFGLAPWALLLMLLVVGLLLDGCDPGTTVTEENLTSVPVKTDYRAVRVDYSGPVDLRDLTINQSVIQPGQEMRSTTLIHPKSRFGSREKYVFYAVTLSGEVVYQRTFTWDELNDLGWKVVIEPGVRVDQVRHVSVVNDTGLTVTLFWDDRRGSSISPSVTQRIPVVFVGTPSNFRFEARDEGGNAIYTVELTERELERQNWTIVVTKGTAP